ncbi:MAG: hypothetical protein AAGC67_06080 [Myxococcota bacterium]
MGSDLGWILAFASFLALPTTHEHTISLVEPLHPPTGWTLDCKKRQIEVRLLGDDRVVVGRHEASVPDAIRALEAWAAASATGAIFLIPERTSENGLLVRMIDALRSRRAFASNELNLAFPVD